MSHIVYPSINSIGQFQGFNSNELQEEQLRNWLNIRGTALAESFIYSGGTLSAAGGLSVNIAALVAVIKGQVVQTTGSESLAGLTNTATNYIYLQITRSGGLATDFSFVANTTGTPPSDSVLIGTAVTSGGSVTSVDTSTGPISTSGSWTGTGSGTPTVTLGFEPRAVLIRSGVDGAFANAVFALGFKVSGATLNIYASGATGLVQFAAPDTYITIASSGFTSTLNTNTVVFNYVAIP